MTWKLRFIGGNGEILHKALKTGVSVIDRDVPIVTPYIQDYRRLSRSDKYELIEVIDDEPKPAEVVEPKIEKPEKTVKPKSEDAPDQAEAK